MTEMMNASPNVKTFRARSLPDALQLVLREFGPDATVLSTRQTSDGLLGRLVGSRVVEVTASFASPPPQAGGPTPTETSSSAEGELVVPHTAQAPPLVPTVDAGYRERLRQFAVEEQADSMLEMLIEQRRGPTAHDLPSPLFRLFTDLLEADVEETFARGVVEQLQRELPVNVQANASALRDRLLNHLQRQVRTTEPLSSPQLGRRVVALIGPTGVGKTTTVAKLAANLRLRDKRQVGLITVDTYRIAAVEQLRAYADIIDLPMEVVTTPREMRDAVMKLADLDLVLVDTAGRSPYDAIQIQELKAMLSESRADEVHLVVSSVHHARHLQRVIDHFRPTGPTALLLTKLDEADGCGHLLPILTAGGLPLSYTTHGQNVPDDIQSADPLRLLEPILAACSA